jgi:integrase
MSIHHIRNRLGLVTSVRAVAAKVNGSQIRASFSVKSHGNLALAEKAAKKWAKEKAKQVDRDRHAILAVPDALLAEVIECLEMLEPHGKSILEVVREYVARPERRTAPWTFREAADAFIASRRLKGARREYLRGLEDTYNLAANTFGLRLLDEITTESVELWLTARGRGKPLSPVTYRNYRRDLRMVWRFALDRHRASHDPITPIPAPTLTREAVRILKAEELEKLLANASPVAQTYIAILAFAGVRPFEVLELSNISIDGHRHIRIEGLHAKSRKRRLIEIPNNLVVWLRRGEGYLGQVNDYWTLRRMLKLAGIPSGQDILRHSFASHHLALHRNAALTAHEMGHHNQQMLFEHYRELVTQEEARAYFGIVPP